MSHYEKRLEEDWANIRQHLTRVSTQVEKAVEQAVDALLLRNTELAYTTILGDNTINRAFETINQLCYGFIARHLPSAVHLRRVSSILRFNIEMERIGDYAVTICREIVQITPDLEENMIRNVEQLSEEVCQILRQAITAFEEDDVGLAKSTMNLASLNKRNFEKIFNELSNTEHGAAWSLRDLFGVLAIYNALGRISDQSKNICEETVFIVSGETKERKHVQILFLDQENNCQSLMAEFIAQKTFPTQGQYTSAGKNPAESLDPPMVDFMNRCGFNLQTWSPRAFDQIPHLDGFDVIVCLQGAIQSYFSQAPFRTIVQEWDVGTVMPEMSNEQREVSFEKMYQEISIRVQQLMEALRGKETS